MKRIYLSLGSNLGDRGKMLRAAIEALESRDLHVLRASGIYETEPRDVADQPWFLNQVVEAQTSLFPKQLLSRVKRIERELGRKPSAPKGPRAIDIDILFYADAVVSSENLNIPHLSLHQRHFVLAPLAELAPDLRHPLQGKTVREMLAAVKAQPVRPHPNNM